MVSEPRILAIEVSGRRGSAAIALGPDLIAQQAFRTEMEHARELLPTVDRLCREHGWPPGRIDQCHLSIGPGSFTGLRVAVAFARHLALGTGALICPVPTLDVIAENCAAVESPPGHLAVVLDAKRRQVFGAVYQHTAEGYRRTAEPRMIEPARLFADAPEPLAVLGEGIDYHRDAVKASGAQVLDRELWWPRAANVHRLGWRLAQEGKFTPARELVPFYLRRPEAEELWEKRHGGRPHE